MGVDDIDLDRDGLPPPPLPPPPPDTSQAPWIVGAILLAVLIGGAARWWTGRDAGPEPAVAVPAATPPAADAAPPAAVPLPPLDEMDPFLRTLLGTLSTRPELARWLATDGLIRQMAMIVDRVAQGGTPARDLKVMAPEGTFGVTGGGRTRTVPPDTYRRYDGIADTIASLDPAAVATAYRTIRPRLAEAYTALGRSDTDVDVAVRRALDVLIATPIPDGPVTVVEGKGATWAYADPALERLDPVQKQLLRLGPDNAARVITLLTAVRQQLAS
jgi:hypothetical protein